MSDLYYGLDFGACNIKVVKNQKGTLNRVKLFSGKANFLENVIYYQKNSDGSIETKLGFNAKQEAILYGDENKISNVKTKLFLKQWSKYIPNMGKDVSCEEAIYDIIDAIYKKIQLNRTDRSLEVITTITVPVAFSEVQKKKLKDICQKVGFTVRAVITEPFAALLSEELDDVEGNQNILVFDFGGSTIDMSVVSVENEDDNILITEMASKGIVFGGLDIDDLIFDYITKTKYKNEYEEICSFVKEERVKHDLMESISSEKEDLFSDDYDLDDEDSNEMKIFYACSGNNKSYYFIVTATEINKILDENHCKDRIITALDELFDSTDDIDKEEITSIKLVGGSSKVVYVLKILTEYFGEEVFDYQEVDFGDDDFDDSLFMSVAQGAAKYMQWTDELDCNVTIKNAIPFNLGINSNNTFKILIKKNMPYGFVTKYIPLLKENLEAENYKVDFYQSFSEKRNLKIASRGEEQSEVIYVGSIQLTKEKYSFEQSPLMTLRVKNNGEIEVDIYECIDDEIEHIEKHFV